MRIDITNPAQREAVRAFVESHGVKFNAADDFELYEYYDIEDVSLTRGAVLEMFNTTSSSSQAHPRGISGCNLPAIGQLHKNMTFIVKTLALLPLEIVTAAKIVDGIRFKDYGVSKGFFVNDNPKLHEHRIARNLLREGVKVTTAGEGTGAAVINAIEACADPVVLSVESSVVVPDGAYVRWNLQHFGTADLSAALSCRAVMRGLRIFHQPQRSPAAA